MIVFFWCGLVLADPVGTPRASIAVDRQEKTCSNCGTVNREGAKFCRKCGRALATDTEPELPPARIEPLSWVHDRLRSSVNLASSGCARLRAEPPLAAGKESVLNDGNFENYVQVPSSVVTLDLSGEARVDGVAFRFWVSPKLGRVRVEGARGDDSFRSLAENSGIGTAREGWFVAEFEAAELSRLRVSVNSGGDLYLYEILVFEISTIGDRSASLLSRGHLNIVSSVVDGCVYFPSEGVGYAAYLIDGNPSSWCALGSRPEESTPLVLAFRGNEEAIVRAVSIFPRFEKGAAVRDELPSRIRVFASTEDPFEGYRPVGDFEIAPQEESLRFEFSPVRARFLKCEVVVPPGKKSASLAEVAIEEGTESGYVSVLFRGQDLAAGRGSTSETLLAGVPFEKEKEPNGTVGEAQVLREDRWVRGELQSAEDVDLFAFQGRVEEEEFAVLELQMVPFLRARARILDVTGKELRVIDLQKEGRGTGARIDLDLPAGEYRLELTPSPVYVLLSYDRSGSMTHTFPTTRDAIVRWSQQLPRGFRVALAGTNHEASQFTLYAPFTDDPARIAEAASKGFSDDGTDKWWSIIPALVEYGEREVPADAVGAIVYVTDGVGTGDFHRMWRALRSTRMRLYTVGFGNVGGEPLEQSIGWIPRRGLFNIAWYRGGRYSEPTDLPGLVATYDRIFDDLRQAPAYALRISRRKRGRGVLETVKPKGENRPIHFILDASGSMLAKVGEKTRLEVAREVIEGVLETLPDESRVGLRVYGHRYRTTGEGSHLAPTDSELLIPIGPLRRDKFIAKLKAIQARGGTPLAYSVSQAIGDLRGVDRPRAILITDGVESFRGDPIQAARDLVKSVPTADFALVGFGIGKVTDKKGLEEMAAAGRGTYYDASDGASLVESIENSIRPAKPFRIVDSRGNSTSGKGGDRLTLLEGPYTLFVEGRAIPVRIRREETVRIEVP